MRSAPSAPLTLSGPAGDASGEVNNNGIQATPDGKALIVAHSAQAALNLVDPATGASSTIADVSLPGVDGLLLEGHRLYAVQNFLNQIAEVRLGAHYRSGVVRKVITSALFQVPATVARFGGRLAAANAKFDTGFPPERRPVRGGRRGPMTVPTADASLLPTSTPQTLPQRMVSATPVIPVIR